MEKIRKGEETSFTLLEDVILHLEGRFWVPNDEHINKQILSKAHETPFLSTLGQQRCTKVLKNTFGRMELRGMWLSMLVCF